MYVVPILAAYPQCNLLIHVEDRIADSCVSSVSYNLDHNSSAEQQQVISCSNVASAFNYISDNVNSSVNCVHVILSSGDHQFTQPENLNVSLILTGSETAVTTIHCNFEDHVVKPVLTPSDLRYTLFFLQVSFVKFEMVQFQNCTQPFRMERVENVTILKSYFTQFSDAVFDLYNCIHINIDNSSFINNIGHGTVLLPLRGNSGAVAIGYLSNDNFEHDTIPTVVITDCHFINNDASVRTDTFSTSTTAALRSRLTGRGGAIALLMNLTVGNLYANISRCLFRQNRAVSFGGAIYWLFSNRELHHMAIVEDCVFIDNVAGTGAGAIQVTFFNAEVLSDPPMTGLIRNCNFTGNSANNGGTIFLFPSLGAERGSLLIIEDCFFYKNYADDTAATVLASQFAFFVPKDKLVNHRIINW